MKGAHRRPAAISTSLSKVVDTAQHNTNWSTPCVCPQTAVAWASKVHELVQPWYLLARGHGLKRLAAWLQTLALGCVPMPDTKYIWHNPVAFDFDFPYDFLHDDRALSHELPVLRLQNQVLLHCVKSLTLQQWPLPKLLHQAGRQWRSAAPA